MLMLNNSNRGWNIYIHISGSTPSFSMIQPLKCCLLNCTQYCCVERASKTFPKYIWMKMYFTQYWLYSTVPVLQLLFLRIGTELQYVQIHYPVLLNLLYVLLLLRKRDNKRSNSYDAFTVVYYFRCFWMYSTVLMQKHIISYLKEYSIKFNIWILKMILILVGTSTSNPYAVSLTSSRSFILMKLVIGIFICNYIVWY